MHGFFCILETTSFGTKSTEKVFLSFFEEKKEVPETDITRVFKTEIKDKY